MTNDTYRLYEQRAKCSEELVIPTDIEPTVSYKAEARSVRARWGHWFPASCAPQISRTCMSASLREAKVETVSDYRQKPNSTNTILES